ncbi:MAG: HEAT repeat domain-containing protein [Candidatus Xenobiia bacterium LiM19]
MKNVVVKYYQFFMRSSRAEKMLLKALEGENIPAGTITEMSRLLWFLVRAVNSDEVKWKKCHNAIQRGLTGPFSPGDAESIRTEIMPSHRESADLEIPFRVRWLHQNTDLMCMMMENHREFDEMLLSLAAEELRSGDLEHAKYSLTLLGVLMKYKSDAVAPLCEKILDLLIHREYFIWNSADGILSVLAASSPARAEQIAEGIGRVIRNLRPAADHFSLYDLFSHFLEDTLNALENSGIDLEGTLLHLARKGDKRIRSNAFQFLCALSSLSLECRIELENCLCDDLGDTDTLVRETALEALASHISKGYELEKILYERIVGSLGDRNPVIRFHALDCLIRYHTGRRTDEKKVVSWCKAALSDSEDGVRHLAEEKLIEMTDFDTSLRDGIFDLLVFRISSELSNSNDIVQRLAVQNLIKIMDRHPTLRDTILDLLVSRINGESDRTTVFLLRALLEKWLPEKYRHLCFNAAIKTDNFASHYGEALCIFVSRYRSCGKHLFDALVLSAGTSDEEGQKSCVTALRLLASAIPSMTDDVVKTYSLLLSEKKGRSTRTLYHHIIDEYAHLAEENPSLNSGFIAALNSEIDEWEKADMEFSPAMHCFRSHATAVRFVEVMEHKVRAGGGSFSKKILTVLGDMAVTYEDLKDRIRDLCFTVALSCEMDSSLYKELQELLKRHGEWSSSFRESVIEDHCREWNGIIDDTAAVTGITVSYKAEEFRPDEEHMLLCISSYLRAAGFIAVSDKEQCKQKLASAVREICRYGRRVFSKRTDTFTGNASRMILSLKLAPPCLRDSMAEGLFTGRREVIGYSEVELLSDLCRTHPNLRSVVFPFILETVLKSEWWDESDKNTDLLSPDIVEKHRAPLLIPPILRALRQRSEKARFKATKALLIVCDLLDDRGLHLIPYVLELLHVCDSLTASAARKLLSQICASSNTEVIRDTGMRDVTDTREYDTVTAGGSRYHIISRSIAMSLKRAF